MIFNIHYFNHFTSYIEQNSWIIVENILRGFSLVAVLLFLTNTAYTSIHLEKQANYKTLFLYVIIPTLLFQQINFYVFNQNAAAYNFSDGFVGSWYGEMYIYVILTLPLVIQIHKKNRYIMCILSAFFIIFGYAYSILHLTATDQALDIWMTIPYVGLVYILYVLIFQKKIKYKNKKYYLLLAILFCIVEILAYSHVFNNKYIIISYFSFVTIGFAVYFSKFIYSLNLPDMNYRKISKTSYFFYFTHYIVINFYEMYLINFIRYHLLIGYILGIVASYVLAYIMFEIYDFIVRKILHL